MALSLLNSFSFEYVAKKKPEDLAFVIVLRACVTYGPNPITQERSGDFVVRSADFEERVLWHGSCESSFSFLCSMDF